MASNIPKDWDSTTKGNTQVYFVKYTDESRSEGKFKLRRCEIGTSNTNEEKVILLVGETGAGKTTIINSILNYLYQVKLESNYRLELAYDEDEHMQKQLQDSQMSKHTKWVSAYVFNDTPDHMPYKVTVIDTPGYECDKNEAQDKYITSQIQYLFSDNESWGISYINAVVFVIKYSITRLTDQQNRIFQSVLSLFGNDIFNIYAFATFGELVESSNAAVALKVGDVPVKECFVVNNGILYETIKPDDTSGIKMYKELSWNKAMENLNKFFNELREIVPNDLITTVTVLEKRETLEIIMQGIPGLLKSYLVYLKELEVEESALLEIEDDVKKHADFKYIVNEEKVVTKKNPNGKMARVCWQCKTTCHYPCGHVTKLFCSSMRWLSLFRGCNVCPKNCGISYHVKRYHRYERVIEEKYVTKVNIREKYNIALGSKKDKEEAVKKIKKRKDSLRKSIDTHIENAKMCIREIKDLSLRPSSYTIVTYLEELISQESKEQDAGWKDRVEELKHLCKREEQ
ncbi:hypothetical protein HOLleu_02156 [Holothuria leucospilota]|uniref:AIG1-type G domain-containing protein n=1 Tax=Holothuria leucospilota TaxID=206669 RepID=A0A9Q1CQA1_HOLLE|nr:hypothetical protein HOLleu_02156 [Holothuria leucospilota]